MRSPERRTMNRFIQLEQPIGSSDWRSHLSPPMGESTSAVSAFVGQTLKESAEWLSH